MPTACRDLTIDTSPTYAPFSDASVQPRARGAAFVSSKTLNDRSVLGGLRQSGSLKLLFPKPSTKALDVVFVNTAGGVTGGDRFELTATAGAGTTMTLTSQAAERAYRSLPGQIGDVRNTLHVEAGATMNWVPQETILFNGCAFERRLDVMLDVDAQCLLCEAVVFGRAAMGETLTDVSFRDRIDVWRDGELLFCDAVRLEGQVAHHLAKSNVANGAGVLASVLFVSPNAEFQLEPIREALGVCGGASLIQSDTLFVRLLASDSFELRQSLIPILNRLLGGPVPRPWMI